MLTLAAHFARRGELGALLRPATVAGMPRFLHTGDWQLGMTRHFLADEAQARFTAARFDAIREIGRVAEQEACEFVVVCGDVFETNQVDRRTVSRAAEALAAISVPVFLLPGNHDPLDAGSVFRSPTFLARKPAHVVVLDDASPREVRPGLEVVGAPWTSKRPLRTPGFAALKHSSRRPTARLADGGSARRLASGGEDVGQGCARPRSLRSPW